MKRILLCSLVLVWAWAGLVAASADELLIIAENGEARCVIAVAAKPSPAEQTAANELQAILLEVTGAKLPIRPCSEVGRDARQIVVGPSARLAELLPNVNLDKVGADGIIIRTVGNALVLAGPRPRGTLYAVYTFLEDHVGCRWWTSTESTIPRKPTLSVPPLAITYAPQLKVRDVMYLDAFEGKFAVRQKLNGHHHRIDEALGGNIRFQNGFAHTLLRLLPAPKYFKEHPEWYSLRDGKRVAWPSQLCFTNDEMRSEMIRVVLELLEKEPETKLISMSQSDTRTPCQCEPCQAVVSEEGAEAGPMLRFVNAVAAEVEKKFPNVTIETMAYTWSRPAPRKVRPRANVVVRVNSIECSFVHPLSEGELNEPFRRDLEAWSKIAPRLFVWDSVANFSNYLVPHPNLHALAPNVRFFVDHNAVGLFEQGDMQTGVGDFVRLRAWLLAHLMWNPDQDENALIDEFLRGYYGPAAPSLRAYLKLISAAGVRSGKRIGCYMLDTSAWLPLDDVNRATELFASAEAAVAGNAKLAARVRRERLPLDHVWLTRYEWLKRSALLEGKPFLGPDDPLAACKEFIRVCRANNVGNWREYYSFDDRAETLLRKYNTQATPPKQTADIKQTDWFDFQEGEFRLARHSDAELVDDAAASDGRAVRIPGDHSMWAVQLPVSAALEPGNPWQVYFAARCDATTMEGIAMTMGIYDWTNKNYVPLRTITVKQAAGPDYRVFDLGVHELSESMYLWLAPPERPGEVQHVYVDRVFVIRAPATPEVGPGDAQ